MSARLFIGDATSFKVAGASVLAFDGIDLAAVTAASARARVAENCIVVFLDDFGNLVYGYSQVVRARIVRNK